MTSLRLIVLKKLRKILKSRAEAYANLAMKAGREIFLSELEDRPDDIYIVTFPKSGTTWMQMICYQLLTRGKMDFSHIYEVSPWLTNAATNDGDVREINDLPSPRVFKSHEPYDQFDPNNKRRIIFVYRDGKDVAVSFNHHLTNYNNPKQTLSNTYKKYFSLEEEYNWFSFTKSWLENDDGLNILYVNYQDLKNDFDSSIQRIANFLDVALTDEDLTRVKERSSFKFMKQHEDKFGEQPTDKRIFNQFIRRGAVGDGKELGGSELQHFNKAYDHFVRQFEDKIVITSKKS